MKPLKTTLIASLLGGCIVVDTWDLQSDETSGDECESPAETVVADVGASSVALAVSDELIAYATREDSTVPTELHVVAHDGSGPALLHSSPAGRAIESLAWAGADVVFLEGEDEADTSELFRVSGSGGAVTQVGTASFMRAVSLLGVEGGAAFVLRADPDPVVDRVDLVLGDVETVGTGSGGTPHHGLIAGGEVLFVSDTTNTVYVLPTTGSGVAATALFDIADHPACGFPLGGLVATPSKLVCGFTEVATFSRAGEPLESILSGNDGASNIVVAASGEDVYMIEPNDGTVERSLRRVDAGGGEVSTLACDVGRVSYQTIDGWFPAQYAYQVDVGSGRIVWVDERDAWGSTSVAIRSAPL